MIKRKKPLKRSSRPSRSTTPTRKTRVKSVNRKRKQSEFARAYGSKERVAWFRACPCLVCDAVPSENAHIITGGMGRKANADMIVPLCQKHHRELHDEGREWFEAWHARKLEWHARIYATRWAEHFAITHPRCARVSQERTPE